jgi:hypothetical protein
MPGADFGQPLGHKPIVINPVPYLLDPLCSPSPLNTTSNEPLQQQTANEGLHAKESSTARITSVKGSVPTKSVQGSAAYKFAQGGAGAKSTKSKAKGLKDPAAPAAVVNMPVSDVHAEDDDSVIQQQMEEAQRQFKKGPKAPLPLQSGAQEAPRERHVMMLDIWIWKKESSLLRKTFAKYNAINSAIIEDGDRTTQSLGAVEFASAADLNEAMAMQGTVVNGKRMVCRVATAKDLMDIPWAAPKLQ